jgi:lysozyme family protein
MAPPLTASLKAQYQQLWESCLVRPAKVAVADSIAVKIRAHSDRYQTVAAPLGVPWYAIGVIHAMECSLDFGLHLHNGDPLTARTVHVPAGRPPKGDPPFTWEASAEDALTFNGFAAWKDWSVAGLLYELEAYNGWGYRSNHPETLTPYLWSFSNHYTKGKYVADGTWSATAVSQQVGAAVLLKRLGACGAVSLDGGVRTLHLANPHMQGRDVEEAQRLLSANPFGTFDPGGIDGDYGPLTASAVKRAKWLLGYPPNDCDTCFGPTLKAFLAGTRKLPARYLKARKQRLKETPGEAKARADIVRWALWGVQNNAKIAYSQGATRLGALGGPAKLPLATDCSGFATLCYAWAHAPNPTFPGPYNAAKGGYTGTMLSRCRHIPRAAVQAGDLVVWCPPTDGHHVCIVVAAGADPWLVSHGGDMGPKKLRFSEEDAAQRRGGHTTATWLSVF